MNRLSIAVFSVIVAAGLSGCDAAATSVHLSAAPTQYLVRLDQLPSPDFSVEDAAHTVDAPAFARTNTDLAATATKSGLQSAAEVRYFRSVSSFSSSNGPIDVVAFVGRFGDADGASAYYNAAINADDAAKGSSAISTGPLGDAAHASLTIANDVDGVEAVQYVIQWRTSNLVNTVLVRGRYGGTRLDDALAVAREQATAQR